MDMRPTRVTQHTQFQESSISFKNGGVKLRILDDISAIVLLFRSRLVEELIEVLKIPMSRHPLSLLHTAFQSKSPDLLASCCILLMRPSSTTPPKRLGNSQSTAEIRAKSTSAIEVPIFTGGRSANIYLGSPRPPLILYVSHLLLTNQQNLYFEKKKKPF